MIKCINNIIYNITFTEPFINPFNPSQLIIRIIKRNIICSSTKPIFVEVELDNNTTFKFIIKKDIGLRKEQMISCLINSMYQKLDLVGYNNINNLITYMIIMLSEDIGLIEFIENSLSLHMVNEKGVSLQNYIMNCNKTCTIESIKRRFIDSLSLSSAISYIIGLGDRHLDNIMIHMSGVIFHIDYGYIMEQPLALFEMPQIKITSDMIDMLEGTSSIYYNDFKKLVIKIFNFLRTNKHIIYQYFKFIANDKLLNWEHIKDKLDNRMMIGQTPTDIEITLINEIENSNSFNNKIADICHMYRMKLSN